MNALRSYHYYYDQGIILNKPLIRKIGFTVLCALASLVIAAYGIPYAIDTILQSPQLTTRTSETVALTLEPQQIVVSTTIPNEFDAVTAVYIRNEALLQEALEKEIAVELSRSAADRILEEQEIAMELMRLEALERYKEYINSIVCDPSDITRVSGLDLEDVGLLTEGTWWEGNEQALYELETIHGINAMFAMSVSTLESYYGTSDRASSRNNYYGLELTQSWDNLYDNTLWWGDMVNRLYVEKGLTSVWAIGPKYCPPNRGWEEYMNEHMHELYNSLITKLNGTLD